MVPLVVDRASSHRSKGMALCIPILEPTADGVIEAMAKNDALLKHMSVVSNERLEPIETGDDYYTTVTAMVVVVAAAATMDELTIVSMSMNTAATTPVEIEEATTIVIKLRTTVGTSASITTVMVVLPVTNAVMATER